MACETDFDCEGVSICFQNVSWAKDSAFCDCSTWYGWDGDECLDYGPGAIYSTIHFGVDVFVSSCFLLLCIADLIYIFVSSNRSIRSRGNATLLSFMYSTLGLLFYLIWKAMDIAIIATPEKHTRQFTNSEEKFHQYVVPQRAMLSFTYLFMVLGLLHVSLMWMEIAHRTEKMIVRDKQLKRYQYTIYAFETLFFIIILVGVLLSELSLSFFAAVPLVVLMSLTYTIGYARLRSVLNSIIDSSSDLERSPSKADVTSSKSHNYKVMVRAMRRTTRLVVIFLYGFILFGMVYAILTQLDWKDFSEKGKISLPVAFNNWMASSLLCANLAVLHFAHESLHGFKTVYLFNPFKRLTDTPSISRTASKDEALGSNTVMDSSRGMSI